MAKIRRALRRLTALFRTNRAETDLAREIDAHLQLLEDKYRAQGMPEVEARQAARREFGGVEQAKEHQRDARSFRPLAGLQTDLKLGVRMLGKSPGLTIIGVIALTVAIGGGAAYYEFVKDFFDPVLDFPGADRLVGVYNYDVAKNDVESRAAWDLQVWRRELRGVVDLGAARQVQRNVVTADGRVEPVRAAEVSASVFRLVPATPLFGRPLIDDDERPGAPDVAVLGYTAWRARFDSDPNVVGREIRIGDTPYTIVGVMPEGFGFPINQELWVPWRVDAAALIRVEGPRIRVFGRLAPGATLATAQAEVTAIAAAMPDQAKYQHLRPMVKPFLDAMAAGSNITWQVRLLYSFNLGFLTLLGVCGMNVATLVFARTATREAEITVRTALGASRARIVSQLVAEAFVLAAIAALIGLAAAAYVLRWVSDIWTEAQGQPMPFWSKTPLSVETTVYASVLVVLAALLVGGVPALKATGRQMQGRLKQAGSHGSTLRFGKFWTGVVVAQVAITLFFLLVLVSVSGEVFTASRTFAHVSFPQREYLEAQIAMLPETPPERTRTALLELGQRLAQDPTIPAFTFATHLPGKSQDELRVELPNANDELSVRSARVDERFFDTFNATILAGRSFTAGDVAAARPVAVVDESFVRLVLGGRNAIGLTVRERGDGSGTPPGPWLEIVGVIRDLSTLPDKRVEDAMLYRPFASDAGAIRVVLHRPGDAGPLATPLRLAAAATDPDMRLVDVMTFDRAAEVEERTSGFFLKSMAAVGGVGLMLSTAGIYSLIAFTLARRTREIGIRTALGATPGRVISGVLSRSFVQVAVGVLLGVVPGVLLIWKSEDLSGGSVTAAIAITLGVAVFIVGVATLACLVPVRRALRVQPTESLRADA